MDCGLPNCCCFVAGKNNTRWIEILVCVTCFGIQTSFWSRFSDAYYLLVYMVYNRCTVNVTCHIKVKQIADFERIQIARRTRVHMPLLNLRGI